MKKKYIWAIIAIIIIVVSASLYLYFFSGDLTFWTEEWGIVDNGLTGEWVIEPYLVFEDGSIKPLKEIYSTPRNLWVKYEGNPINTIIYKLSARGQKDDSQGSYESVEIDMSGAKMCCKFYPLTQPAIWLKIYKTGFNDVTLDFPEGYTITSTTEVAEIEVPSTANSVVDFGGVTTFPWLGCQDLGCMTNGWASGTWTVQYYVEGTIKFRGLNSDAGNGEWVTASLPPTITHLVEIGSYDITINFSTDVSFT